MKELVEKKHQDYKNNPKKCEECGVKLSFYQHRNSYRFCGRSCSAAFNNRKKRIIRYCKFCNRELMSHQKSYCGNKCQGKFKKKKTVEKIEQSGRGGYVRTAKAYLIDKYGPQCMICKRKTWNNKPIPLNLDHIDGNHLNDLLTNLRIICCNCDAQTDTYKAKNKGNGRHSRRQRYKEGKSY